MKFFNYIDFGTEYFGVIHAADAANIANEKLERNGKVIHGAPGMLVHMGYDKIDIPNYWIMSPKGESSHQALLINIEPISPCTHPKEKVQVGTLLEYRDSNKQFINEIPYRCECGVTVKPTGFSE